MGAEIHEINIRVKYVLTTLHQILVIVLKFAVKNHDHCSDKNDLEKGLAEIVQKNLDKFKKTSLFKEHHYKKYFYDPDPIDVKKSVPKARINFDTLDVSSLSLLITKEFIYHNSYFKLCKCCDKCKHGECSNIKDPHGKCQKKANCDYDGKCTRCNSVSCSVVNIKRFCNVVKSFRDCFAHDQKIVYKDLASPKPQGSLEEFPCNKTWEQLWTFINQITCNCLKVVKEHDLKLLSMEDYKDFKMELRFALRKEIHCLLPVVESRIRSYYEVIFGEEERQDLRKDINSIRKDCVLWNKKTLNFDTERTTSDWPAIKLTNRGCILQYDNKYKVISIQCRRPYYNEWYQIFESPRILKDVTEVEIKNLHIGDHFEFRGLFEDDSKDIVLLATKESIEIKKVEAKDLLRLDDETYCIQDCSEKFKKLKLEVKYASADGIEILLDSNLLKNITRGEAWDHRQNEAWIPVDCKLVKQEDVGEDNNLFNGYKMFCLTPLEPNCLYDIRLIGGDQNGTATVLSATGVKTGDPKHDTTFHQKSLISHPFGLQSDAWQHLKTLPDEQSNGNSTYSFSFKSGICTENIHITDNDCLSYVMKNFWFREDDRNEEKSNIVVPHLEQLDQKSLNYKMAEKFRSFVPKKNCFLFTRCNLYKYLRIIGYRKDELERKYDGHLKDLSNVMVFYPAGCNAVVLITLPETEHDTIHDLHLKANSNVKAYQTLHRHRLIGDAKFFIVSIVGAVFHKKEQQHPYCSECEPELTIFADDFESEESFSCWWKALESLIERTIKTRSEMKSDDVEHFKRGTASMLVVYNALTDDRFPRLHETDDNRITKMVLNEVQRNILLNPLPKKIFKGGYGVGKSTIIQQEIQRYQEKEDHILCYIGFDEYTLFQVLMEEHCAKTSESLQQNIVCKSVVDLSLEVGSHTQTLTLVDCLKVVQERNPGKRIDVVIDEMDSEDLQKQQVEQLKETLELPAFKSSKVLIAMQPCEKKRKVMHNHKLETEMSHCYEDLGIPCFEMSETMRFTSNIGKAVEQVLGKVEEKPNVYPCGLDTDHNHNLISSSSTSITNTSVTNTSITNTSITNTSVTNTSITNTNIPNTSITNTSRTSIISSTSITNTSIPNTSIGSRTSIPNTSITNTRKISSTSRTSIGSSTCSIVESPKVDEHQFEVSSECEKPKVGELPVLPMEIQKRENNIVLTGEDVDDGNKKTKIVGVNELKEVIEITATNEQKVPVEQMKSPSLKLDASIRYFKRGDNSSTNLVAHFLYVKSKGSGVNIPGDKSKLLRLETKENVRAFAYFLKKYCMQSRKKERKMMLICNTVDMIPLAKAAMDTIAFTYVEYTDNIQELAPKSTAKKKKILDEWRNKKQVLLVDPRGCKGMEYKETLSLHTLINSLTKVVVLWSEQDHHSRHMFGEAMARARSCLHVVTVKAEKEDCQSNINEAVDLLSEKDFVEDVTVYCMENMNTIKNPSPLDRFLYRVSNRAIKGGSSHDKQLKIVLGNIERKLRAPEEMLIQEIHPFAQKLVSMGFPEHSSVDAVNSTGEKDFETALNWILARGSEGVHLLTSHTNNSIQDISVPSPSITRKEPPDWVLENDKKVLVENYYNRLCEQDFIHTKTIAAQRIASTVVTELEKELQVHQLCRYLLTMPSVNEHVMLKEESIRIDILVAMYNPSVSVLRSQQYPGYLILVNEKQGFVPECCLEDQLISPHKFQLFLHKTIENLMAGSGTSTQTDWNQMLQSLRTGEGLETIGLASNSDCNLLLTLSIPNVVSFELCLIPCVTSGVGQYSSLKYIPCQSYDPNDMSIWRPCHLSDEFHHLVFLDDSHVTDASSVQHHQQQELYDRALSYVEADGGSSPTPSQFCKILKLGRWVLKEFSAELTWFHFMNAVFVMHYEHCVTPTWAVNDKLGGLFDIFHILEEMLGRRVFPQYYNPGVDLMHSIDEVASKAIVARLKEIRQSPTMLIRCMEEGLGL